MLGVWKQTVPALDHIAAAHFVERYIGGRPCLYDAKHYEPRKLRNAKYARYDVNTTRWHKFQGKGICEENVSTRGACAKIKWLCFNGNLSWTERDFPYAVAHGMHWQVFRSFAMHFVRSFNSNPNPIPTLTLTQALVLQIKPIALVTLTLTMTGEPAAQPQLGRPHLGASSARRRLVEQWEPCVRAHVAPQLPAREPRRRGQRVVHRRRAAA